MKFRDLIGYLLGLIMFVILIPLIMWRVSDDVHPDMVRIICLAVMSTVGIGLSVWSIDGPYRLCRNPMLLGVIIYYMGILIFLLSWQAVIVFVLYFMVMMLQVRKEEIRLEQDFGESYRKYCEKTKKLIPYIW